MKWSKRKKLSEVERAGSPSSRPGALAYRPEKNSEVLEEELETGEIVRTACQKTATGRNGQPYVESHGRQSFSSRFGEFCMSPL
jgi:hypothetical protein